jgi:predicted TIM-barrel fold metal-dependent hydrolase
MLARVQITNCHTHTFTHEHAPDRLVRWPLSALVQHQWFRTVLLWLGRRIDPARHFRIMRQAQILEVSFNQSQEAVFERAQRQYPADTRFVILPMDMTFMGAGRLQKSIDEQHSELKWLYRSHPEHVIAFAAADPRHTAIVAKTKHLLEHEGFRGIKLYPPLGYDPDDAKLRPLYEYAEQRRVPVLTHCSRRGVKSRGEFSDAQLDGFTDPDRYLPILDRHPELRLCLAHFGGDQEWDRYLADGRGGSSWLAKILAMLRSESYPNLWTDIAYTLVAEDRFLDLLQDLLAEECVRRRLLFGSDFYVVLDAQLLEAERWAQVQEAIGAALWQTIAEDNPREFLGF